MLAFQTSFGKKEVSTCCIILHRDDFSEAYLIWEPIDSLSRSVSKHLSIRSEVYELSNRFQASEHMMIHHLLLERRTVFLENSSLELEF